MPTDAVSALARLTDALARIEDGFREIHSQVHTPEDAVWHCANVIGHVVDELRALIASAGEEA